MVDTSFFPSSGAVNPALTAMANALRVGDHLLERLGVPSLASGQVNGNLRADTHASQPHSTERGCANEAAEIGVLGSGRGRRAAGRATEQSGNEVTVIATERTAVAIELTGLKLRTPHEQLETRPVARPWLTAPVEVLFVTTRATDLPAALERIPPALLTASTIVPLRVVSITFRCSGEVPRVLRRGRQRQRRGEPAAGGLSEQHSIGCELRYHGSPSGRTRVVGRSLLRGPGVDVYPDPTSCGFCGRNSRPSRRTRCLPPAPTLRSGRRESATRIGSRLSPTRRQSPPAVAASESTQTSSPRG